VSARRIESNARGPREPGLRLGYLVNDYPSPSVTFIRREIVAIESLGCPVLRFAVRPSAASLVTPADVREAGKTRYLLAGGALGLLRNTLAAALRHPARFALAVVATIQLSRGANRGVVTHLAYLAQACVLLAWTRAAGITHLHVHFASNPAAIALLCRRLGGPRWSLTVHGPEEFEDPAGHRLREKIAEASFVAAISSFTARSLSDLVHPQDRDKIHIVRCGVDEQFLHETPTPIPTEPSLVCVGRLSERKRQILLLRAVARVVSHGINLRLTLIGDGPTRGQVEREIETLKLADHVNVLGWRSEQQVREAIRAARAFVLPSSSEGLPVALMEALVLGRLVITTPVAGVPELVEDGVSGWLVPVDDVDALAQAIEKVLATPPAVLEKMADAGRRKVIDLHNVTRSAQTLLRLFQSAAR
jgi:colanic acid/amylovoran biosynthesis glycosyltransferase